MAEYLAILEEEAHRPATPPHTVPTPPAVPFDGVLRDGVGVLDDVTLASVATDPATLRSLESVVERAELAGNLGEAWGAVYDALASDLPPEYVHGTRSQRLMDEIIATERGPDAEDGEPNRSTPRRPGWRAGWRAAGLGVLAASLLLAFYLGTFWSGKDGRQEIRLASVAVRGDVTRGIEDVALDVTNGTDRRAFLTVVGLIPGRPKPGYFYRSEEKYLELLPGGTTEVKNLPPVELEGSTVLLLVTTDVPAGEAVRNVTPPAATPETAGHTADHIRRALGDLNIRADVRVIPLPPPKR